MLPIPLRSPAFLNNYAYGSFTSQGPVTALGSALKAFWTADDHGTANMTDDGSGLISSWKDKVGGSFALTAATTARPTWAATSFYNSYAGVTFDGVANNLAAAATTGLPTGTAESWIIILADNQVSDTNLRVFFGYGAVAANQERIIFKTTATTNRYTISDGATALIDVNSNFFGPHLVAGHWSSATEEGYFNTKRSSPISSATSFNTVTTRTRMGASVATSVSQFSQAVVRYVFVTGALTALQLAQIEGWAMQTSGLNGYRLPTGHPFRDRRP